MDAYLLGRKLALADAGLCKLALDVDAEKPAVFKTYNEPVEHQVKTPPEIPGKPALKPPIPVKLAVDVSPEVEEAWSAKRRPGAMGPFAKETPLSLSDTALTTGFRRATPTRKIDA